MQTATITPERFQQLAAVLGWDPDRAWLLGARLVQGLPYRALAAATGRSEGALRDDVYRARKEADQHEEEARRRAEDEEEERREQERYLGLFGTALLWWDLTDHHFPLWACVLVAFGLPDVHDEPLPLAEQWQLMEYKWERDKLYAEGKGPAA